VTVTENRSSEFVTSGVVRLTRSQLVGTLSGLMLGMLLAALDQTIVGTAEPKIIAHLSGFDRYPWVSTTYLLTSTISVPISAKLSDIYGRKRFFLMGSILFVLASALCGASGNLGFLGIDGMNQLVLFRGLQGVGAGMLMALALTIIGDIFSPTERGRYQALFSAVWGSASVLGPTLGGWLTDRVSWRAVFYVNLPVGLVAIAAICLGLPSFSPHESRRRLDWAGTIALIACMVPLLIALTWVTNYGWTSARVESLLAFAVIMLGLFLYIETKVAEPLIPLSLFREPVIAVSSLAIFVLGMGMFAVIIYLPLFMQGVMGVSATRSGNLLLPLMLGVVVGSALSGQTISRLKSYKTSGWIGSIAIALGMILFARMDGSTRQIEVLRGMVLAGLGMGFVMPVYTVAVQNAAPRKHLGAATSSTMFFRSIGSTVGVAIFGSVLLTNYQRDFARGVPPGLPQSALVPFQNPLMLAQFRGQLEATFSQYPGGMDILNTLFANVRFALIHGLRLIFISSAIIMTAAAFLNVLLRDVPLRSHSHVPEVVPPAIDAAI
jgi:EmrB/QacA subfamily drug resistance transporter